MKSQNYPVLNVPLTTGRSYWTLVFNMAQRTNIPCIRLVPALFISISMVLMIFILPDTKFTFPKIPFVFRYESSVVDNWKVILDTCVQHGSEQQCLVEMDRITRKNFDLDKEMKETTLQPRKSLVTFETQIDIILVVLDNLSVD
jgi:hypothetical protein